MDQRIAKWMENIAGGGSGGAAAGAATAMVPTIDDYYHMFRTTTLHQQALSAIVNAIITDKIAWTDDPDRPVPKELYSFIETAVGYLMVTGFLIWRSDPTIGIEVAHPMDMSVAMDAKGVWFPVRRAHTEIDMDGWVLAIMDQPVVDSKIHLERIIADTRLTSAVARAFLESMRFAHIEAFWMRRDAHNSKPAAWTTVSNTLSNVNGSTRPWFRGFNTGNMTMDRNVDPEVSVGAAAAIAGGDVHTLTAARGSHRSTLTHSFTGEQKQSQRSTTPQNRTEIESPQLTNTFLESTTTTLEAPT